MSAINMTANHLRKDEVAYELKIRGVDSTGLADELRKRLNQCFTNNVLVMDTEINKLDAELELEQCKEKWEDIASLVDEYDGKGKDCEYQRLSARLYHLYMRIERIPVGASANNELEQRKADLLGKTKNLLDSLKGKKTSAEEMVSRALSDTTLNLTAETDQDLGDKGDLMVNKGDEHSKQVPTMERTVKSDKLVLSNSSLPKFNFGQKEMLFSSQPRHQEHLLSQSNYHKTKSIPVYKWGIKFNHENKQSIGSFLERVEELRRARGVSEQELFESAVDLFEGSALVWYRSTINRISSWKALCKEMRTVFQAPDYEFRLQQEIFSRMQGDHESIDLFIAAMEGLYSRLSENVPETVKLNQIYNNLHPQLQDRLAMFDISSIEELRFMGRKAEVGRLRSSLTRSYLGIASPLEPDLACSNSQKRRNFPPTKLAAIQPSRLPNLNVQCWNCGVFGHRYAACNENRKKFCYGCGQPDVIKAKCGKCMPKNL